MERTTNTNNQSNSSKRKSCSEFSVLPYKKLRGTNNAGREFEYFMCALYALKLCTNKEIVDFQMTTNNEEYGAFDDISLKLKTEKETKLFLLQLKHKENKNYALSHDDFMFKDEQFYIIKYLNSFEEWTVVDVSCIIYTNGNYQLENEDKFSVVSEETTINVTIKEKQKDNFLKLLQNKSNQNVNEDTFQFQMTDEKQIFGKLDQFCESCFLMTGQDNLETVKATVRKMLLSLTNVDIYDSFVSFMKEWWSGELSLTKRFFIEKLVELALSPWIQTVSQENVNDKTGFLLEAIENFEMTIVRNKNKIINNIWKGTLDEKELTDAKKKYYLNDNPNTSSKILWLLDKVPLIVRINSKNKEQVKCCIELVECLSMKKKIVLVGDLEGVAFSNWKVLENLKNISSLEDLYKQIICNLTISPQGRKSIDLEQLIRNSADIVDIFEIDDLLKMTQECLKVGDTHLNLPESYIPRKVSEVYIETTELLNTLQHIEKNILIINCHEKFKNTLNTKHATIMELQTFLIHEKPQEFENLILLSTDKPCTHSEFESVHEWKNGVGVYLFQASHHRCILLMNGENTNLLKNCTKTQIGESEVLYYFKNTLNVVLAPPGMGKSTFFNELSKNCPPDLWVVHVKLMDYELFLNTQSDEQFLRYFMQNDKGSLYTKLSDVYLKNKKILILLDGADELQSQNVNLLLERCKLLSSQGFHVWVSSRENYQEKIFQHLKFFTAVDIVELSENEQKDYIEKRLKNKYDSSDIEGIVDAIFESSDISNSRQLLGIPLQLYIITENFLTNENLLSTLMEGNSFVLTTMYRLFFQGKKMFHFKKVGLDKRSEQIGFIFEHHLELYELPAISVCLDGQALEQLNLNDCDCQKFLEDIKTKGDKFGIIKNVTSENKVVFCHQTYAEYFACVWFTRNLDKIKLLREKWFLEKYQNLRLMFDIMLSEQSPLHLAVIHNNIEQFHKNINNRQGDKAGRSALYLACSYGMKHPLPRKLKSGSLDYSNCHLKRESEMYIEIVHSLLKQCKNILAEDTLFGINFINYALSSRCLRVIEASLERKLLSFEQIAGLLKKYYTIETLVFYASQMDYIHLLENVLEKFHYNFTFRYIPSTFYNNIPKYPKNLFSTLANCNVLGVAIVGRDPHQIVPRKENIASVETILKNKNRVETWERCTIYHQLQSGALLRLACYLGCSEIIKILSTYQTTSERDNMLYMTVEFGTLDDAVLELSKNYGLDVNQAGQEGKTPLYMACENSNEQFVEKLLDFGAKIDVKNESQKYNVFHVTAKLKEENLAIMQMLLKKIEGKSLVNIPDYNGCYPVMLACEMGHINYVKLLLKNGANMNVFDSSGNTVLHYSARASKENEEIINISLRTCLDINHKNDKGETALHIACKKGIFSNVKLLIDRGSDLNFRSHDGNSCLHYAAQCYSDNTETIKFLIDNNLQIDAQNNNDDTPLHVAWTLETRMQYHNIKVLLENGADANKVNKTGKFLLHNFITKPILDLSSWKIFTLLLSNDVNINSVDRDGNSALHLAFDRDPDEMFERSAVTEPIETLLENGADPNIPDIKGRNVLHKFVTHISTLYFLPSRLVLSIIRRVNINAQDNYGKTALHLLLYYGTIGSVEDSYRIEIAKNLLEADADVNIFDNQKMTALHYEARNSFKDATVLELLKERGASCNIPNSEGQTPLHLAVKRGKWNKVKFLLENGADINVMDNEGMTVLHYVIIYRCHCDPNYIKLLLDKGVKVNAQNKKGETALHLALETRNCNTLNAFSKFGADMGIVDYNKENVFHHAMRFSRKKREHEEVEEEEEEEEKEEDQEDEKEDEKRKNLLKIFIDQGVNINAQNIHGESPLHLAFQNQHSSIVEFLLQNGAMVNLTTLTGRNMLHYAAESCYHNYRTLLVLNTGFDENAQDVNGTSILHCACKSGRLENIKMLISSGANIYATDNKQQTILHYAAMSPHPEKHVMNYLVETDIDIHAKNADGKNALDVAFEHKCFRALQLLIETNIFFHSTDVSWSKLLYYSAFSGCCHAIEYWIKNIRRLDRNKNFSLEFLNDYGFRDDWLLKMTQYAAKLIRTFEVNNPTYDYEPLEFLEYIKLGSSRSVMESLFRKVIHYRRFMEDQVFEGKKQNIRIKANR